MQIYYSCNYDNQTKLGVNCSSCRFHQWLYTNSICFSCSPILNVAVPLGFFSLFLHSVWTLTLFVAELKCTTNWLWCHLTHNERISFSVCLQWLCFYLKGPQISVFCVKMTFSVIVCKSSSELSEFIITFRVGMCQNIKNKKNHFSWSLYLLFWHCVQKHWKQCSINKSDHTEKARIFVSWENNILMWWYLSASLDDSLRYHRRVFSKYLGNAMQLLKGIPIQVKMLL